MQLWVKNEAVLVHKTGLTAAELENIWSIVKDTLVAHYERHHHQREPPMSPFNSLLATLYWMRVYPSTRCIAAELDVDDARLCECLDHTLHSLFTTLVPAEFADDVPPPSAFSSGPLAGVCAVVDSTHITLPHNPKAAERKQNYHFKSGTRQALKVQVCVTPDGKLLHISKVVQGSMADVMLLRESDFMDSLALTTRVLGDKAYIGEAHVVTPKKKPKGGELKESEKKANKEMYSTRVVVENWIHQFKRWAIVGGEYRGHWREHSALNKITQIAHVVASLAKRYITTHPLRARSGDGV
jgi:hypothetical protein